MKMEFEVDPLTITSDTEILNIVDENSMASNQNDEQYSVKTEEDVETYHVIHIPEHRLPTLAPKITSQTPTNSTGTVQPCQFYLISNDLMTTAATNSVETKTIPGRAGRTQRDDKRRATHNEVERRRRDKINHWIMKLGSIIPEDTQTPPANLPGGKPVPASESLSKSGILSKACEYIPMLQENINSLNECLKDTEKINLENKVLRESNMHLCVENVNLKMLLKKHGIEYDPSDVSPSS